MHFRFPEIIQQFCTLRPFTASGPHHADVQGFITSDDVAANRDCNSVARMIRRGYGRLFRSPCAELGGPHGLVILVSCCMVPANQSAIASGSFPWPIERDVMEHSIHAGTPLTPVSTGTKPHPCLYAISAVPSTPRQPKANPILSRLDLWIW